MLPACYVDDVVFLFLFLSFSFVFVSIFGRVRYRNVSAAAGVLRLAEVSHFLDGVLATFSTVLQQASPTAQ